MLEKETTIDDEMLEGTSYMNMTQDDSADKITSDSSDLDTERADEVVTLGNNSFVALVTKLHCKQLANFVDPRAHIDFMMDKARRKEMIDATAEVECNREAIKILLDITKTLARQGLALRGSSEESEQQL